MNTLTRSIFPAAMLAALVSASYADIIELKDGRKIDGALSRTGDTMVIKPDVGTPFSVTAADVLRVTLVTKRSPADAAIAQWNHLTVQIKQSDSLAAIIDLHEKFLAQFPDPALSKNARDSLNIYKALAAAHGIKFHGTWIPFEKRDLLITQWSTAASPALNLYTASKYKESLNAAKSVLATDSQNPDALAIAGLAAYRSQNFKLATRYFTSLAESDPNSVLAWNNLAVINAALSFSADAFIQYARALQIAPPNRIVLDNVAEAMHDYVKNGGSQTSSYYRAIAVLYPILETDLKKEMAEKDLYRLGSAWVTRTQLDQARQNAQTIRNQMTLLEGQYKAANLALKKLDIAISGVSFNLEAEARNILNVQSLIHRDNLDMISYDMEHLRLSQNIEVWRREKQALADQREKIILSESEFLRQAEILKTRLSAAENPYTGKQTLIELTSPSPAAIPAIATMAPTTMRSPLASFISTDSKGTSFVELLREPTAYENAIQRQGIPVLIVNLVRVQSGDPRFTHQTPKRP